VNSLLSGTDPNFFYSGFIFAGNSWSHTFTNGGTFSYKSTTTNLTGSVTVTGGGGGGGGGGTPTPTPSSSATATPTATGPTTVNIAGGAFAPSSITVPAGTTVTWTNNSGLTQTVTSTLAFGTQGYFTSGFLYTGKQWSWTFSTPGTFTYKSNTTMITGTVIVTGGATPVGGVSTTATPTQGSPQPTPTPTGPWPGLAAGWTLAIYGGSALPAADAFGDIAGAWQTIYYWDGSRYHRFFRPGSFPTFLNDIDWVTPGQAFWIYGP